ncbi:hypothetical protein GQ600_19441 [Phytophthora cactorum]|nr:hypothetical protein GQ600_19441 [Phytophthora cactorum]
MHELKRSSDDDVVVASGLRARAIKRWNEGGDVGGVFAFWFVSSEDGGFSRNEMSDLTLIVATMYSACARECQLSYEQLAQSKP